MFSRNKKMLIIRQLRINIQCACRYATQKKPKYRMTKIDKSKFSKNPGIQNQLQLFSKNNSDIENMKPEDINPEALEADFMKAEDMVDDYERYNNMYLFLKLCNLCKKYLKMCLRVEIQINLVAKSHCQWFLSRINFIRLYQLFLSVYVNYFY